MTKQKHFLMLHCSWSELGASFQVSLIQQGKKTARRTAELILQTTQHLSAHNTISSSHNPHNHLCWEWRAVSGVDLASASESHSPLWRACLPPSQKLPLSKSPASSLITPWSPKCTHPWINPKPTFHASDHQILPMLHTNSRWPYMNLRVYRRGEP